MEKSETSPMTAFKLFGKNLKFILDTGTNLNIISKENFLKLDRRPKLQPSFINAYGFHSKTPVPILGEFMTTLFCENRKHRAKFLVLDGNADNLLGYHAAKKLGLVEIKTSKIIQEDFKIFQVNGKFEPKKMFPELFENKIGLIRDVEVIIEVDPNIKPKQIPPYPIPLNLMNLAREKIMLMKEQNIIEPAEGKLTWVSPAHFVPKINPTTKEVIGIRCTSNNKALNKAIKMEKRWMPSIKTITYELNGMRCFSKIDMRDAFNQIALSQSCRNLTAFTTPWGVYVYTRLNMGLAIASELFQMIMTDLLRECNQKAVATDDIIVWGKDYDDCLFHTEKVLRKLCEAGATLSGDKCRFMQDEIEFYGHKISKDGLVPLESKINDFINTSEPNSHKELHSFLGSAAYFNNRSPHQAEKAKCLRAHLKIGGSWEWKEMHKEAFNSVKNGVIKTKLAHFNPNWITELIVDAGPEGCAALLTQVNPKNQNERTLINCTSYEFSDAEFNYAHVEKEAFACVWACMKNHLTLYGTRFNLITDNIACQKIFEEDIPRKRIPTRLERLKAKLAIYNAKVIFRPGISNPADYLSRKSEKLVKKAERDRIIQREKAIMKNKSKKVSFKIRSVKEIADHEIPYKMTLEEIAKETSKDVKLSKLATLIGKFRTIKRHQELKEFHQVFNEMSTHESGVLLRNELILIPESLRDRAVQYAHEGHMGIVLCKRLLRNRCWWPGLDKKVEETVDDCPACQANTDTTHHEPMIPTRLKEDKMGLSSIDFSSATPSGEYLLVIHYETGRLPVVKISNSLTTFDAINICKRVFKVHGIPRILKSDNGPAFKSSQFAEFARQMGFIHQKVTPLNPEANGACERMMQPINKAIRCAEVEKSSWKTTVSQMLRNYRATPHTSTGISPDVYMSGDDKFDKIPTLRSEIPNGNAYETVRIREAEAKEKQRKYADAHQKATHVEFKIGGFVMHKWDRTRKHQPLFDPNPYVISAIKGNMITVSRPDRSTTRNSRFFKSITEKCYKEALRLIGTKKTRMDTLLKYMLHAPTIEPEIRTELDHQAQQLENVEMEPEQEEIQERYPRRIRKQAKAFDQSMI